MEKIEIKVQLVCQHLHLVPPSSSSISLVDLVPRNACLPSSCTFSSLDDAEYRWPSYDGWRTRLSCSQIIHNSSCFYSFFCFLYALCISKHTLFPLMHQIMSVVLCWRATDASSCWREDNADKQILAMKLSMKRVVLASGNGVSFGACGFELSTRWKAALFDRTFQRIRRLDYVWQWDMSEFSGNCRNLSKQSFLHQNRRKFYVSGNFELNPKPGRIQCARLAFSHLKLQPTWVDFPRIPSLVLSKVKQHLNFSLQQHVPSTSTHNKQKQIA